MEDVKNSGDIVNKREVLTLSEWRSTQIGMWAWLLQRFSALGIIVFVTLHLVYPYQVLIQTLMALCVCFHAVLGLRVIILDLSKRVTLQKVLFGLLMILGAVLLVMVLKLRIFYF
ncbi:MAG: succinate dehydrogenase [Spirochaetota bacterium]|nr:succinate dehydrogenase [Spirochaetota bacterium]